MTKNIFQQGLAVTESVNGFTQKEKAAQGDHAAFSKNND